MIHDITIKPCLNGFIVTVGCQIVVFNSVGVLCDSLGEYLRKSDAVEATYRQNALNRWMFNGPISPRPEQPPPTQCLAARESYPADPATDPPPRIPTQSAP